MFDVSFSELMVIAVVALVVIGPDKLPKVARTIGFLVGRMQRYTTQIKHEIDREIEADEFRQFQQKIQQQNQTIASQVVTETNTIGAEVSASLNSNDTQVQANTLNNPSKES